MKRTFVVASCGETEVPSMPETGLEPARAWLAHQPLKLFNGRRKLNHQTTCGAPFVSLHLALHTRAAFLALSCPMQSGGR